MSDMMWKRCWPRGKLSWLTGPIFDKELRVSSRRRRNYVLRFVYIALFLVFASLIWIEEMPRSSASVVQVSRMARAALSIVVFVVWFQFIVSQLVAIVMLSTAISDEVYGKTLGLLMTTPVGSFQIVLGKLLSKLLQLLLLMAITLPLLAIVRILGGVPWQFLVCGLCMTVTTALFCGALSLFFSIFTRKAYAAIIAAILVVGVYFAVVPMVALLMLHTVVPERVLMDALSLANPYVTLIMATETLMTARGAQAHWLAHCGLSLAGSALLLFWATVLVRKVALRQATGQPLLALPRRHRDRTDTGASAGTLDRSRIRRVTGAPVFWKERRSPLLGRLGVGKILLAIATIGLVVLTYILCAREHMFREEETQITYVVIFFGLGTLFTAVLSATSITSEKESRSWPILLTTTVTDWSIVWGKFLGAVRRCSVAWLPLSAHVVLFTLLGNIHPVGLVQLGFLVAWLVVFLCATGLYFSTRLARTTTAVIANVSLAAGLWALGPLLLVIIVEIFRIPDELPSLCMDTNPFVHAVAVTEATAGGAVSRYDWVHGGMHSFEAATAWMVINGVLYTCIALIFLVVARRRLRRKPV